MPRSNPYAGVPSAPLELDLQARASGRDIELEIGFGRGQFILDRAEAHPETVLLGLEMRRKWVDLVTQRAQQRGCNNVEVLFGDARLLLPSWGPEASLAAVFINFPDPWWKKKHKKRRVVTSELLREVGRLLRPDGVLLVQTDVPERAVAYHSILCADQQLSLEEGSANRPSEGENPLGVMSHREKKCQAAGLPVYRFLLRRRS